MRQISRDIWGLTKMRRRSTRPSLIFFVVFITTPLMENHISKEDTIMKQISLFKTRVLRVRKERKMICIIGILGEAGVLIDGRYRAFPIDSGTQIEFLATDTQWKLIKDLLEKIDELEQMVDD